MGLEQLAAAVLVECPARGCVNGEVWVHDPGSSDSRLYGTCMYCQGSGKVRAKLARAMLAEDVCDEERFQEVMGE